MQEETQSEKLTAAAISVRRENLGQKICLHPRPIRLRCGYVTHGKFLTHDPAQTIEGSFTAASTGGVITLNVPVAHVRGNANAKLFSITALTATPAPATQISTEVLSTTGLSTAPIFDQINATVPLNFTP